MTEQDKQIEEAKTNYSPVWSISNKIFTQAACEILKLPIERVEVRRCVMMGDEWGKLSVYIYKESDEEKAYYRSNNGAIEYRKLSPNLNEFKSQLTEKTIN